MPAAAAPANASAAVPAKKGKKKLIILLVAVLLLVVAGGGAAVFLLKKKATAGEDGDEPTAAAGSEHRGDKPDLKHPPTFLPADPFIVNLSDKDADRYAQIGITFEVEDAKFAESMKAFMPAIRNGVLMILSHKTSADLLDRAGKEKLAEEIQRDAARTMGIEVDDDDDADEARGHGADKATDEDEPKPKKKKKKKKAPAPPNPIRHVHFSNFIVQ